MENKAMLTDDLRLARQSTNSSQDFAIRRKLDALLSTDFSRKMVDSLRERLEIFFTTSLSDTVNSQNIRNLYNELLPKLKETSNASITKGEENLTKIKGQKGVIVVTNHLGLGVLTIIDNKNGKYPVALSEFAGFPVRLSALSILSEIVNKPLFEAAIELPEPLLSVQKATPTVLVPIDGTGRTQHLVNETSKIIDQNYGAMIVMYPEGGTSGKRNDGGPYDMDTFHSGAFVVAQQLGLPILPVCQMLNPQKGLELHILPAKKIEKNDPELIKEIMEKTRNEMQSDLDNYQSK